MEVGIIVIGHGNFGTGITSALELIAGVPEHYVAIDFPRGMSIDALEKAFDSAASGLGEREIAVLVDLFGGSPFNVAMRFASENRRLHLLYGMNVGMLLELAMRADGVTNVKALIDDLEKVGRESVGSFKPDELAKLNMADEDEEGDTL